MDNFNIDIENRASKLDGDYIQAIIDLQRDRPDLDYYDIRDLLDPIVLNKVKLTAYQHGYFPDKRTGKSLDDIFG